MNSSKIPKPGAPSGPCKMECGHDECLAQMRIAIARCAICGEGISFNCVFCPWPIDAPSLGLYAHLFCLAITADHAWDRELKRLFGNVADCARYDERGRSTPELARLRAQMLEMAAALRQAYQEAA